MKRFFTPQIPVLPLAEYRKQGIVIAGIDTKVDAIRTDLKELAVTMNSTVSEKDTELKSMALKLRESQQREAESARKLDASERKAERSEAVNHYFFGQINGRQLFPAASVAATDVKLVEPMLHMNHSVVLPLADSPVPTVFLPVAVSEPVTTGNSPVPGRVPAAVPAAGNVLNNVTGKAPPPGTEARAQAQDDIAPSLIAKDRTKPTAAPGTMLTISPPPGDSKRRPRRQLLFNALNLKSASGKLKKTPKKKSVNNSNQNPRVKELLARRKSVGPESDSDNSDNSGWESEESSPVVFARRPRVPTPSSRRAPMSLLAMINSRKSGLRSNSNNVNICKK